MNCGIEPPPESRKYMIATTLVPSEEAMGMTKLETLGNNVFGPADDNESSKLESNCISSVRVVV